MRATDCRNKPLVDISPPTINTQSICDKTKNKSSSSSFVFASSMFEESKLLLNIAIRIGLTITFEMSPAVIAIIFLGHLPNPSIMLSGSGLANSFSSMFAVGIAWGMTSGLYTLVPQALGAQQPRLLSLYVQRAWLVITLIMIPLSILQFFGGTIICFILPNTCKDIPIDIITNYCRALIPFVWSMVALTICQRVGQSLNYNTQLLICTFISVLLSVPLMYLFVYIFHFGYLGTAYVIVICNFITFILSAFTLIYYGYGFIFMPLPFHIVCTKHGLWEYFSLSFPGCFNISIRWIIREMIIILCGLIYNPSVAISVAICAINISRIFNLIGLGISRSVNIRVGKYIGADAIKMAKQSAFVGGILSFIWVVIMLLCYTIFRKQMAIIFTNDESIISIVANVEFILMIRGTFWMCYQTLCGIYNGLGYQRISSYIQAPIECLVSLPLAAVLLFAFGYDKYTEIAIYIIWGCHALGISIGASIILLLLIFYVNWDTATNESRQRIKKTMKTYGSITSK